MATLKCDKVSSVAMPTEEWELLDRCARESQTTRNELIRRCIHFALRNLLLSDLSPISVDCMLREARGELLTGNSLRGILTGR